MIPKVMYLIILFVVTLLLGACARMPATPAVVSSTPTTSWQVPTSTPGSQAALTPTGESTPTPQEQEIAYDDYGFRLTLPPGYRTVDLQNEGELLLSLGIAEVTDDTAGDLLFPIGLRVFEKPDTSSLLDWFSAKQDDCYERGEQPPAGMYFIDPRVENQVDFKGNLAMRYESGCWPVPYEILIDRGRLVIALYYLRDYPIDYEQDYNRILTSLEFSEPALYAVAIEPPSPPTPTPTVCLDEAAQPIEVPPLKTPLEVRFISDGDLWAWTEGEPSAQQISDTGDAQTFSFSLDGRVIAFTRGEPYRQTELWTINRDGSGLRLLLSADQLHALVGEPTTTEFTYTDSISYIDWMEGTGTLGFEVLRAYDAIGGCCESGGTWQVDVNNGQLSPWTPPPDILNAYKGLVSPDSNQIALAGETGLTLVNADDSNRREDVLTYPHIPQMEGGGFIVPYIAWAPDSRSLAVITYSENIWEQEATFTTWFVPTDGTPPQQLGTFSGFPFSANLSPDQRYLAYRYVPEPMSNNWELHLATIDGSRDIVYAEGHLMDFWGWSPDGVNFVFGQGSTRAPLLGSVCGGVQPLLDPPEFPLWHLTWIDPGRFVYLSGSESPADSELRLGKVGNGSVLIGSFRGEYAYYQVVPDPRALERQP